MIKRINVGNNKQIVVRFSHPHYFTSIKLTLSPPINLSKLENNMPIIQTQFNIIMDTIILDEEQKQLLNGLSSVMKGVFIKQYQKYLRQQNHLSNINYLGKSIVEHSNFIEKRCLQSLNPLKTILEIKKYFQRSNIQEQIFYLLKNGFIHRIYQILSSKTKQQHIETVIQGLISIYYLSVQKILLQQTNYDIYSSYIFQHSQQIIHQCLKLIKFHKEVSSQSYSNTIKIIKLIKKVVQQNQQKANPQARNNKINNQIFCANTILTFYFNSNFKSNQSYSFIAILINELKITNNLRTILKILSYIDESINQVVLLPQLLLLATNCIKMNLIKLLDLLDKKIKTKDYKIDNSIQIKFQQWRETEISVNKIRPNQTQFINLNRQITKVINVLKEKFSKLLQGKIDYKKFIKIQINNKTKVNTQSRLFNEGDIQQPSNNILFDLLTATNASVKSNQQQQKLNHYDSLLKQADSFKIEINQLKKSLKQKQQIIEQLEFNIGQIVSKPCRCSKRSNQIYRIKQLEQIVYPNNLAINIQKLANSHKSRKTSEKIQQLNNILPPPPPLSIILKQRKNSKDIAQMFNNSAKNGTNQSNNFILPPPPPSISQLQQSLTFALPPPPPSLPSSILDSRKSRRRKQSGLHPQMKTIGWNTIDVIKIKDSFWDQLKQPQINEKELIKYFSKQQSKNQAITPQKWVANQQNLKSLLKPDRAKNIEIVLKKLKFNPQKIIDIIIKFDENYFNQLTIQCLLNIIPTQKQVQMFINLTIQPNEKSQWSLADYYLSLATKMDDYYSRLKAIMHKYEYQQSYEHFFELCNNFTAFFKGIMNDRILNDFLRFLLKIGNFLNENTYRSGAYGFKLDCVDKTYTLIANDQNTSLFQYILKCMWKDSQAVIEYNKIINKYKLIDVTIVSLSILNQQFTNLNRQYQNIQKCLVNIHSNNELIGVDKVTEYLLPIYGKIKQNLNLGTQKVNQADVTFKSLIDYYCDKVDSQKIWEIVKKFRQKVTNFAKLQTKLDINRLSFNISNSRYSVNI